MNTESKGIPQRVAIVLAIVVALLLILNGFFIFKNLKKNKVMDQQVETIALLDSLNQSLNSSYTDAVAQLDRMKGENEDLNEVVEEQKDELRKYKDKVARMIKSGRNNKGELERAQRMMSEMQGKLESALNLIEDLKAENASLKEENSELSDEKSALEGEVAGERAEKERIAKEKSSLEDENMQLQNKKARGEILFVKNIVSTAVRIRKNGEEKPTSSANRTDRIKTCFMIQKNLVAERGRNQFHIRIITPLGQTITQDPRVTFTDKETNKTITYTVSEAFEYKQEAGQELCVYWNKDNQTVTKGTYSIELYNKGFKVGESTVSLKR